MSRSLTWFLYKGIWWEDGGGGGADRSIVEKGNDLGGILAQEQGGVS